MKRGLIMFYVFSAKSNNSGSYDFVSSSLESCVKFLRDSADFDSTRFICHITPNSTNSGKMTETILDTEDCISIQSKK